MFVVIIVTPWGYTNILDIFSLTFTALLDRIFWKPAWLICRYFEVFPDKVEFLNGASIGLWSKFIGQPYFDVENYMAHFVHPGHEIQTGFANAAFFANLYADFGMLGIFLGTFFIGIFLQMLQTYMIRRPKNSLFLSTYIYLIFAFFLLNSQSFVTVLNTNGVVWVFVLLFLLNLLKTVLPKLGIKFRSPGAVDNSF